MLTNRPFIVAEIGANHLGSFGRARVLIRAAKDAGADAVKFQTYEPSEIAASAIIDGGPWDGRNYRSLYAEGMLPWDWHKALFKYAYSIGIVPFSSPFSEAAVARLETIDCPIYKIASPEITHLPLIAAAARTGKTLIISTGMASISEILQAEDVAIENGAKDVVFLHCISAYPAKEKDFNLCTLNDMREYGFRIGLSDHSLSSAAARMAIAMGAEVIEKHFTLSRKDGGLDAAFSLQPEGFRIFVDHCRSAYTILGNKPFYRPESENVSRQYRRSIWLVKDIQAGETLTAEHLAILRPNYGVEPEFLDILIGKSVNRDLTANTPMSWDYV